MARRTLIWHIGPADPGTDVLATSLKAAATELADHGVLVPHGAWHEIEDQIWKHKGLSLLSTPAIARADQEKVALRLSGLRDVEVHLVLLVRDLPTQVHAAWQAALQHGSTTSLKKYAARVMDPARDHWQAEDFWAGRDLARVLPLWTRAFHADRVHVVALGSDPSQAWTRFLRIAGLPALDPPATPMPRALAADLDAEQVLDLTTAWAKLIADRGFDMQGSLLASAAAAPAPADRGEQFDAVAELLASTTAEVERLRSDVRRLQVENERLDRKRRKWKRRATALGEAR